MPPSDLKPYKNFHWIVADPELLGGKLAIRGTRFSVSFILSCLADGMSVGDIEETYGTLPHDAIPEILKVASEILDAPNVAA
ncbi:MAG TPA: DUF433 domain-containing protein [Bryobacteraceae bacterium]|nr:DUF433 domain-containing protein [Bryobacteraceae bacterium]